MDKKKIEKAVRMILEAIGSAQNRDGAFSDLWPVPALNPGLSLL